MIQYRATKPYYIPSNKNVNITMLPIQFNLRTNEDELSIDSSEGRSMEGMMMVLEEEENPAVQIIGLDVIESTHLRILRRRYDDYLLDGSASIPNRYGHDDDDSSCLSDNDSERYANDSIELNGRNCRRNNRRRLRPIGSNDSYANDSLEITRKKFTSQRKETEEKDRVPIGTIEIMDLSTDGRTTPHVINNHHTSLLDIKGIIAPVATPDVATMRRKRISNSAA